MAEFIEQIRRSVYSIYRIEIAYKYAKRQV